MRYSVIIPHYNNTPLLRRCLDSIPAREDIEIIIVDDNSPLENNEWETFPGIDRKDTQCIFTKESLGAGYARNIGLSKAHGEWLIFADADDYFTPEAFDIFDKYATSEDDLIYYHTISRFSDTGKESDRNIKLNELVDAYMLHPCHESEGWLRYNFNEPWGKMIRHKMVREHNIQFEQTRWGNDMHFSTLVGYHARSICAAQETVYCVTVTHGSLVHQYTLQSKRCRYEVLLRNNQFLREVGLGEFQCSIMHSIRAAFPFGITAVLEFIVLGFKYHANFFIGYKNWIRNFVSTIHADKNKEKYIIRNI